MSKGGLLCFWLLLLQVCVAHQELSSSLISSSQLVEESQIGGDDDDLLLQDPIGRARLMPIHGRDEELGRGRSADSISDDGVDYTGGHEYESINCCVPVAAGRGRVVGYEEEEEGLLPDDDDDGGDSGGTTKGGSSGSGGGGDVECPECGKFFKNDKSMFGHLRSHPNRGYKGAIPPVKKLKLSLESYNTAAPVKKLRLSPETAAAAASASSSSPEGTDPTPPAHQRTSGRDPQLTPLEILCACVLLTLKYREHDTNDTTQQVPQPPPSSSFEKLDDAINGQAEGGAGVVSVVAGDATAELIKCNNAGAEAAGTLENRDEHDGNSIVKIPRKRRNMIPKEVRKKAKLIVLPTPPKEKRPYACKHCKAEFPTNQALGGHVAGHHREKKVPRLSNPSAAMAAESQNGKQQRVKDGGGGDDDDDKDLSLRRGGLLSGQFSMALDVPPSWQSGQQASGGKMSRHHGRRNEDGLSMAVAPAPTPTTPVGDGGARRPWNIDLNVKAPEQE